MLTFEEMRTLYASSWEIWKRNREMNDAFQKHLYHHGLIKWFSEIKCSSQTMHAFLLQYSHAFRDRLTSRLRRVKTEAHFLLTLNASLPWFFVQLDFYAYCTQKFAIMWLQKHARDIVNFSKFILPQSQVPGTLTFVRSDDSTEDFGMVAQ